MTRAKTKKFYDLRLLTALGLFLIVSGLGATQIVSATNAQLAGVERDASATLALSVPSAGFENYLLVGSDSREGVDPNDPDFATMGSGDEVSGRRSDTLMIFITTLRLVLAPCFRFQEIFGSS